MLQSERPGVTALLVAALLTLCSALGCSTRHYDVASPSAPNPIPIKGATAYAPKDGSGAGGDDLCEIDPSICKPAEARRTRRSEQMQGEEISSVQLALSDAPAVSKVSGLAAGIFAAQGGVTGGSAGPPPPPQPIETGKSKPGTSQEMVDIEARVTLKVEGIAASVVKIRQAVKAAGGQVVNEVITDSSSSAGASISLRIPSGHVFDFLSGLPKLGKIESRKVESRDIGREFHDAQVLLRNLNATLSRYEQLLKQATTVKDMVTLEAAMARVRTRLDRVKGDLRYLQDRASRSTVYITLRAKAGSSVGEPEARLYPGLRGTLAWDFPSGEDTRSFAGAGFSLYFFRALNLDADFMGNTSGDGGSGVDLFITTLGTELYSDFLGGGDREFLNPYLGFRVGYARNLGLNELALGGSLGLDVWKADFITIDLNTRLYAFLGTSERRAHAVLQPNLTLRFSY